MNSNALMVTGLAAAFCVSAVSAKAVTYQDIDKPGILLGAGESYTGSFNILTGDGDTNIVISGYNPIATNGTFSDIGGYAANGTLISAYAFFYLKDANQGNDRWDIDVQMHDFLGGQGTLSGVSSFTHFDEVTGTAFDFLNNNGVISYKVTNTGTVNGAKFTLEFARLTATTADSVPDGGATAALLGLSMVGMGALRRKMVTA